MTRNECSQNQSLALETNWKITKIRNKHDTNHLDNKKVIKVQKLTQNKPQGEPYQNYNHGTVGDLK